MSSSRDLRGATLLRGGEAATVPLARMDASLRTSPYVRDAQADPRMVDPRLERAFAEAVEAVRATAYAEGFELGRAQGAEQALAEAAVHERARDEAAARDREGLSAEIMRVVGALGAAAGQLEARAVPTYAEAADELGPAALALVRAVVGCEPRTPAERLLAAVSRLGAAAPAGAPVTVRLNPDDAALVAALGLDLSAELGRPATVVADASVEPGGAVGTSGATLVDARLSTAFARLAEALGVDEGAGAGGGADDGAGGGAR